MNDQPDDLDIGVGPTDELSLRVSVAALVRVLFENPENGELMLALERKGTLLKGEGGTFVEVKSQPFGGALRILNLEELRRGIGDFHFDSKKSCREQDLRIFINPAAWDAVREFCLEHITRAGDDVLESDPWRELTEEFAKTLTIDLKPEQLVYKPVGTVIEDAPAPTENADARGYPTIRVYRIFEAHVLDGSLAHVMLVNSTRYSNHELQERAREDERNGGRGWATTVLTLPLEQVRAMYLATAPDLRQRPIAFPGHQLDETVAAVLENVPVPRYRRV